jgi:hypothetical protein
MRRRDKGLNKSELETTTCMLSFAADSHALLRRHGGATSSIFTRAIVPTNSGRRAKATHGAAPQFVPNGPFRPASLA